MAIKIDLGNEAQFGPIQIKGGVTIEPEFRSAVERKRWKAMQGFLVPKREEKLRKLGFCEDEIEVLKNIRLTGTVEVRGKMKPGRALLLMRRQRADVWVIAGEIAEERGIAVSRSRGILTPRSKHRIEQMNIWGEAVKQRREGAEDEIAEYQRAWDPEEEPPKIFMPLWLDPIFRMGYVEA